MFAFCSEWWRCYDRGRQAITLYRSESGSNRKEIWFPVMNAGYFSHCPCPDGSLKPLSSFPPSAILNRGCSWHRCSICGSYPVVLQCADGKRVPFSWCLGRVRPSCEKHLEPKLLLRSGYFKPFVHVVPPLITACNLFSRYGVVSHVLVTSQILGDTICLISSVRVFSCSAASVTDVPNSPRMLDI